MNKTETIGLYGINWPSDSKDLTEKDYETIFVETTKIIKDRNFPDKEELSMAYYNRGKVYSKRQKYKKALKDYTCSIKINNKQSAYFNRALMYGHYKKYKKAIKDFESVLEQDPNDLRAKRFIEVTKEHLGLST
jgi:tetratricopeptide (TPR) repeat protein